MFGSLIQYLLSIGVPAYTLYLLLALPVVAMCVTISRYIVGWKSLNIYTHVLMTYAFLEIMHVRELEFDLLQGLINGMLLVVPIAVVSLFLQKTTSMIRMHYVAKVAGIMTALTLWVLGLVYLLSEFGVSGFATIHPLALVISIVVLDPFVKSYIRKGPIKSYKLIANTIGLSVLVAGLLALPLSQDILIGFPETTVVAGLISIWMGRWTGLRLSEIFRFKDISIDDDDTQHLQK